MRPPVLTKADMYARLAAGEFGNTTRQHFSVAEWKASGEAEKYPFWGVRTLTPGGPCRLNCPVDEVHETVAHFSAAGHRPNISMMVDAAAGVDAWLELWDSPTGLVVEGVEYPDVPRENWRNTMPDPRRRKRWEGVAARMILAKHTNENDREDFAILLEQYPDHVLEFSALDRCLGTVPHRRCCVWELRQY